MVWAVPSRLKNKMSAKPRDGFQVVSLYALHSDVSFVSALGTAHLDGHLLTSIQLKRVRQLRVPVWENETDFMQNVALKACGILCGDGAGCGNRIDICSSFQ